MTEDDGYTGMNDRSVIGWDFDFGGEPGFSELDEGSGVAGSVAAVSTITRTLRSCSNARDSASVPAAHLGTSCYVRGTRILTPTGETFVENLQAGDLIVTRFNGMQPIAKIGRESAGAYFAGDRRDRLPVLIYQGALAERMPARDLRVSPSHCLLIGGRLLRARDLINGITITQDLSEGHVDYFGIELSVHDCVIAEGIYGETSATADGVDNGGGETGFGLDEDGVARAFGGLCAERLEASAALEQVLRPIVDRAAAGLTPGSLRGYIDSVEAPWRISGWAHDAGYPDLPVLLEILLDNRVIGTALACQGRADLEEADIGRGRAAFSFTMPFPLNKDGTEQVCVRRAADGAELAMSQECYAKLSSF